MQIIWINKTFEVQGEIIEIDYETYRDLNTLAAKFWKVLGYEAKGYHDFFKAVCPQEHSMFAMALEAYTHDFLVGLD